MPDPTTASSAVWQAPQGEARKGSQPVMHNRLNPDTDVMLRVECMSSRSLKALMLRGEVLRFFIVAILIIFIVLESLHIVARQHKQAAMIASACIGGICSAVLTVQCIWLLRLLRQVNQQNKQWTKRRKCLVTWTMLSIALMEPAFLLWMSQNAWAASGGKCRSYSNYCRWAEAIVWTLFNCWLLVQLVLVHAATAWLDDKGKPLQRFLVKRKCWLEAAPKPALIVDAPWAVNITKLLPWAVVQTALVLQLVAAPQGQKEACARDIDFDLYTPCKYNYTYRAHQVVAYVGLAIYMCFHVWYLHIGRKHHSIVPYSSFRIGLVLMRTQEGNSMGVSTFSIVCVSWILTIIFRPSACIHCLQASTHIVMVLAVTRLVIAQFSFFIPKSGSKDDPIVVQEWLQIFAWTEHTRDAKHAERQSYVPQQQQKLLEDHPIFCFETAIKLLYWCGFVYEHDEGRPVSKLSQETALKLFSLDHFQLIRCTQANVKCLVAWSHHTLVVAFRGTANLTNACADVKAWMVHQSPVTPRQLLHAAPKVHSGFHSAWEISGLKAAVMELIQSQISSEAAADMTVFLTGHSLGGAMANLAAVDISRMMTWASVKVYTVGAPRVGNHAYARMYNKLVPDTWSIINHRDPVPQMAKFWFLYARPGQRVLLYEDGDMVISPTPLDIRLQNYRRRGKLKQHKLTSYRAALVAVLKAQIKNERLEPGLQGVMELADSVALKGCVHFRRSYLMLMLI
ncbi:TPA: hypothetical protein ACH3X1_014479 [Trebouxia sp. C0004]